MKIKVENGTQERPGERDVWDRSRCPGNITDRTWCPITRPHGKSDEMRSETSRDESNKKEEFKTVSLK